MILLKERNNCSVTKSANAMLWIVGVWDYLKNGGVRQL
jgi:hypothetical protein